MKKILVSRCIYGWNCRYDAVDYPCLDKRFIKWKNEGRLIVVCPEECGCLPTPRPNSQIFDNEVMTYIGLDVTEEYEKGAS